MIIKCYELSPEVDLKKRDCNNFITTVLFLSFLGFLRGHGESVNLQPGPVFGRGVEPGDFGPLK